MSNPSTAIALPVGSKTKIPPKVDCVIPAGTNIAIELTIMSLPGIRARNAGCESNQTNRRRVPGPKREGARRYWLPLAAKPGELPTVHAGVVACHPAPRLNEL